MGWGSAKRERVPRVSRLGEPLSPRPRTPGIAGAGGVPLPLRSPRSVAAAAGIPGRCGLLPRPGLPLFAPSLILALSPG